jgi:hypothetical protein
MEECLRVIKSNGMLYVLFPQYYAPFDSHLGFVTWMPFIN